MCVATACGSIAASAQAKGFEPVNRGASTLGEGLEVPAAEWLVGRQLRTEGEAARRSNPESAIARRRSRVAFKDLGSAAAANLAAGAFPGLLDEPAGGLPELAPGEHITGYPSVDTARVSLPGDKHAVIVSPEPLAVETSHGRRSAINMHLVETAGAFEPQLSPTAVRIPAHLSDGARLPADGISMTPVSAAGSPLHGEGVARGAAVFYANTETATDASFKPLLDGFAEDTILRSATSPEHLYFHLGLPAGATILTRAGDLRIVAAGDTIATVPDPTALDAEGQTVPVHTSVLGHTLELTVAHTSGDYLYPIDVDPTVIEKALITEGGLSGHDWAQASDSAAFHQRFFNYGAVIEDETKARYEKGQYAYYVYETQGQSHIYEFTEAGETRGYGPIQVAISIASPGAGTEAETIVVKDLAKEAFSRYGSSTTCTAGCEPGSLSSSNENNRAYFEVRALEGSSEFFFTAMQEDPSVYILQEAPPSAQLDTSEESLGGKTNAAFSGAWVNTSSSSTAVLGIDASDPGIGVNAVGASSPGTSWGYAPRENSQMECPRGGFLFSAHSIQCNECDQLECATLHKHGKALAIPFSELGELPEGEPLVEVTVEDATGLKATVSGHIKVDNTPPRLTVTTPHGEPANESITEGIGSEYHVTASATSIASPSAGVKSLSMTVDGREIGKPSAGCPAGPSCNATGEWTLDTSELGSGEHQLSVTTTDYAGNVATKTWTITVRHGTPVALGPGAVNPESGEFLLSATDASVAAPGSALNVERHYRSRHLTAGAEGPLGPEWSLSVGGQESLTRLPDGSVTLTSGGGGQTIFAATGGGKFASPSSASTLALTEVKNEKGETTEYVLRDSAQASTTRFTSLSGPTGTLWKPTKQEGPLSSQTVRYIYELGEDGTEPHYAIAPEPAGLSFSCVARLEKGEALEKGCRALEFKYATATTAEGNNEPEWGNYKGRLEQVSLLAYSPSAKAMSSTPLAQYAYDATGRLRSEWNPEITPALKTTYGYDTEDHVTAVSPPGEQPWLFSYGTVAGTGSNTDDNYLLSVTRPPASTKLGVGSLPVLKTAPKVSPAAPTVGKEAKVSTGKWLDGALAFAYQWERCTSSGTECTPIVGAVNETYLPGAADAGHELEAEVTAMNASGARATMTAASKAVKTGTPKELAPPPPSSEGNSIWTVEYGVALSGAGLPTMTSTEVAKWGQKDDPVQATAIFPPDEPMGWPAQDYTRATITYFDGEDRPVDVELPGGGISTAEYNSFNDVVRTLDPDNRAAALSAGCESAEKCASAESSRLLDTENAYEEKGSEPGTELLSTLGPQHLVRLTDGLQSQAREQTLYGYDEGAPAEGGPYRLVTKTVDAAIVSGKEEEPRTTVMSYSGQEGLGWKLRKPTSVTSDPTGLKLTHTTVYEPGTGAVEETRSPANSKEKSPHASEVVYYSVATNATYKNCGEHPEWANLPCETKPARQPETAGLPQLPTTTYEAYDTLDEPEKVTEAVGSTLRTTTSTYDLAGRLTSEYTSSTVGKALPKVTFGYTATKGAETGALTTESRTLEKQTQQITSVYNTLGQLVSYTDGAANASTYEYDADGRVTAIDDGKGTETFHYAPVSGALEELLNEYGTSKLRFTGTYDAEGNLLTEGYPNGMTGTYTYNGVGKPVGLEYKKTTDCTSSCTWFYDRVTPSIHGQWVEQTSSLSHESYVYDSIGRLTQVQDTPTGKKCITRAYGYDEDTNRTSLTSREAPSEGGCTLEGATVEKHTYDEADRLTDTGTSYSQFGDVTALPASDAGGAELTSQYYVDNQLASQTQNGETLGYNLDPAGRTLEAISTGPKSSSVTYHYAGPGADPAWSVNLGGETSRNIPGINGELAALQTDGETPVLQLANLHGDIVATAYLSETATGLASEADTTEYGVPTVSAPAKYSWLGEIELPTAELPASIVAMGARSYDPYLGRFLQPDPSPTGSANAYAYTFGDPVNTADPSGEYSTTIDQFDEEHAGEQAGLAAEAYEAELQRLAEEAAARQAAEWAAQQAAEWAALYGPQYEEEGWGEEEWDEEEGEELLGFASYDRSAEGAFHEGGSEGAADVHTEDGLLYQPIGAQGSAGVPNVVVLCVRQKSEPSHLACARYAGLFGEIVGGIEKVAKGGWHVIKHAASSVWHWVKTHASLVKTIDCNISGGGAGVLTGVGAAVFTKNLYISGAIGAAVASGVTYACEHQSHGF
jgi:RHS repeat-associated protein